MNPQQIKIYKFQVDKLNDSQNKKAKLQFHNLTINIGKFQSNFTQSINKATKLRKNTNQFKIKKTLSNSFQSNRSISNQNYAKYFNQNSDRQSTNWQDYSEKSYLQSLVGSQKMSQSRSIAKRNKKINENEINRIIEQSKEIKYYLDEEKTFSKNKMQFYYCSYCDNDFQGRYDIDGHKKIVHPEDTTKITLTFSNVRFAPTHFTNRTVRSTQKIVEIKKELKFQQNSQTQTATSDALNSSIINDLTKNFNKTINHALIYQPTAFKSSKEQDIDEEDDKKQIFSTNF